jgi:hypothetical protein
MTLSRVVTGAVLTVFLGVVAAGCSSSTTTTSGTSGGMQDRGIEPGTGNVPPPVTGGTEVNPDGKPYPTKNLGYQARAGARAGNIMRNYKFLGYRDGDPSKGTTVISLADFFDPAQKSFKLIHFSAGALWCPPCNDEADKLVPLVPGLKTQKIVVIQALVEGDSRGSGSTMPDLDTWQKRHKVNYTLFLDPEQGNLGQFFDAAAIPWNAYLDARSMEILQSGVGEPQNQQSEYDTWVKWIDANPAQAVQ